jgi:hypothetical protein
MVVGIAQLGKEGKREQTCNCLFCKDIYNGALYNKPTAGET